jgi:pimeloyl-ACP methyl ester carboxylesterase
MRHAESAIIAETGHSSYWENPQAFNSAVLAFLGKHSSPAPTSAIAGTF